MFFNPVEELFTSVIFGNIAYKESYIFNYDCLDNTQNADIPFARLVPLITTKLPLNFFQSDLLSKQRFT